MKKTKVLVERKQRFRRAAEDCIRSPDGRTSEAKIWANVGKAICVLIILWHLNDIVGYSDALVVLLLILVMPDLLKKWISMRYNGPQPPAKFKGDA